MARRSNKLIYVVVLGAAAYFFKDKLIALYHSVVKTAAKPAAGSTILP